MKKIKERVDVEQSSGFKRKMAKWRKMVKSIWSGILNINACQKYLKQPKVK